MGVRAHASHGAPGAHLCTKCPACASDCWQTAPGADLLLVMDYSSRMMTVLTCGLRFTPVPEVSPLPLLRLWALGSVRVYPYSPGWALLTEERCTCFLDHCKGSPIVPTEVKDSTSVPGVWFRSIYVPQVHCGTGHFPRGPLNTIRRTPLSRGNGRSIIIRQATSTLLLSSPGDGHDIGG